MGGVEFSTLYLCQRLDRDTWSPLVIVPGEGEFSRRCAHDGIPCEVVPLPVLHSTSRRVEGDGDRRLPSPAAWFTNARKVRQGARLLVSVLAKKLEEEPISLLVTKGMGAHFSGGLAARQVGIPCLWHLQDLVSERFLGLYARGFGMAVERLPGMVVADGSPIVEQLPLRLQARARVVLNGVDTEEFRPPGAKTASGMREELGIPAGALVVGHAARLTVWKGQHHLLEAFLSLAGEYPEAHLLLVGSALFDDDHFERSLRERAASSGLGCRVHFTGFRSDLAQVLRAMDIFAYPSLEKDTSPLALLSAMATGLPVAAYDIPGVREVVGDDGLLVPAGDTARLAAALLRLLEDAALRQELSGAARRRAVEALSLEVHTRAMEAAFAEANERGRS